VEAFQVRDNDIPDAVVVKLLIPSDGIQVKPKPMVSSAAVSSSGLEISLISGTSQSSVNHSKILDIAPEADSSSDHDAKISERVTVDEMEIFNPIPLRQKSFSVDTQSDEVTIGNKALMLLKRAWPEGETGSKLGASFFELTDKELIAEVGLLCQEDIVAFLRKHPFIRSDYVFEDGRRVSLHYYRKVAFSVAYVINLHGTIDASDNLKQLSVGELKGHYKKEFGESLFYHLQQEKVMVFSLNVLCEYFCPVDHKHAFRIVLGEKVDEMVVKLLLLSLD